MENWKVVAACLLIGLLIIVIFFRPLPEGTRVVVNGYGVYNPYCYGDSFLRWNAVQIEILCQPTAVSNKEGVITRGGDYDAAILNGAYRVVLDEGNPRILWFRVGEVKKAK